MKQKISLTPFPLITFHASRLTAVRFACHGL
jgi:hypothetical protein